MKTPASVMAGVLNRAIKSLIQYDPKAAKKLKPLAGKTVKLVIEPIHFSLLLTIREDTLEVSDDKDTEGQPIQPNTTISGKPSALFAMGTNQHIPGIDGVNIQGDASTGQFVADFLKQLDPDWEDAWCDLLGEGPGYHVSQFLNSMKSAGTQLFKSLRDSSHDYLTEESREVVTQREMEAFLDGVDDLRADWTRLERKWQQYQKNNQENES